MTDTEEAMLERLAIMIEDNPHPLLLYIEKYFKELLARQEQE